jgi:hypothetical protein
LLFLNSEARQSCGLPIMEPEPLLSVTPQKKTLAHPIRRTTMRVKGLFLLAATAAFVLSVATAASTAEKRGKPLDTKPSVSDSRSDNWRARAMKAHSEFAPGEPLRGNARALDDRGDRKDGEEAGAGALGQDRGQGGGAEE